jgi:hypothetical protein
LKTNDDELSSKAIELKRLVRKARQQKAPASCPIVDEAVARLQTVGGYFPIHPSSGCSSAQR